MRILITGGAGFIGSNLTDFHVNKGDDVYIIDNFITGQIENIDNLIKNGKVTLFRKDIVGFDYSQLPDIDLIYHLASPASPIQYKKHPIETLTVNSEGTKQILEYIKNKHITFVLASTSEVYGDPEVHPQIESYWGNVNPVGIRSCYDEGKRFAEAITMTYFRKYKIDVRIARIFNTYGPKMEKNDGRVVSNFIMQAITNKSLTIYGNGNQSRSFCYVSDMVNALFALASTKDISGEIINLGNPDEYSILELARIIKQETGSSSEIVFHEIDGDDPKKRKPDIGKAIKLLNWQPSIRLKEGLLKSISYFKERFIK